ncbi:MAG: hypothetical protein D3910_11785, partial [Candidatus Electrothrix sp. ATG2]|nr:hypothetical protein [Candidatus Electrothrix sp. ATG2]
MKKINLLILCLFCMLAAMLYMLATAKPQLNVIATSTQEGDNISIIHDDNRIQLSKRSLPEEAILEISLEQPIESAVPSALELEIPRTLSGGILNKNRIKTTGQWEINEIYPNFFRFKTTDSNAKLFWEGFVSGLHIRLKKTSAGGTAKISWNGQVHRIDLHEAVQSWEKVTLKNDKTMFYTTLPLFEKSFHVEWKTFSAEINTISVALGNKVLFEKKIEDYPASTYLISLPNLLLQSVSLYVLKNIFVILSVCIYLFAIYLIIGFPLVFLLPDKTSGGDGAVIAVVVGFCFFHTMITSLIYLLSFYSSLLVVAIIVCFFYVSLLARWKKTANHAAAVFQNNKGVWNDFISITAVSFLGVIVFFSQAFVEPGWFFGRSQTDSFYYINQAQNLLSNPHETVVSLFSLTTIRYADLVTLATNAFFT